MIEKEKLAERLYLAYWGPTCRMMGRPAKSWTEQEEAEKKAWRAVADEAVRQMEAPSDTELQGRAEVEHSRRLLEREVIRQVIASASADEAAARIQARFDVERGAWLHFLTSLLDPK